MRIARDIKRGLLLRNSTRDETHKTRTGLGPDLVMHKIICTGLGGKVTLTLEWPPFGITHLHKFRMMT